MLQEIKLKNYKSFGDISINFNSKKDTPKHLIAIYGENGSGKSNLISAFSFLFKSTRTLEVQHYYNDYALAASSNDENKESMLNLIQHKINLCGVRKLSDLILEGRTIDTSENMEMEFIFLADSKKVIYKMIFDKTKIIYESLSYPANKNMTLVYEIRNGISKFNNQLFLNTRYESEIQEKVHAFFGMHTFLSILAEEYNQYNAGYIDSKINPIIKSIFKELYSCSVYYSGVENLVSKNEMLEFLGSGTLIKNKASLKRVKLTEDLINKFITTLYSDIKKAFYLIDQDKEVMKYHLYFKKVISNKLRIIPYELESRGTQKLVGLLPALLDATNGRTVFVDEIDTGIHDGIMVEVFKNLEESITGQLIMTTHNTALMNNIKPESIYVIDSDINGNKSCAAVTDYERIQKTHNVENRYINGLYGGVPYVGYLDFDDFKGAFNK